ncbi:cysteine hydrolase family protein [Celeribacter sp.]|uniref:cysteine hydrolase family protein n=1 Tax=Celeribacter sp. TaxID=1890673 RepID=UPI003A8CCD5E
MALGYLIGVLMLSALVWLGYGAWRIGAISRGQQIGDRAGTALLLIDLQTVFWDDGPYSGGAKAAVQKRILDEVDVARSSGAPVIAVRQEWSIPSTKAIARIAMHSQAIEGTSGTELAEPFSECADHVLIKRVQDAFETTELDSLLQKYEVGRLRVVGLDLSYCVLKTVLSARKRGYDVTIVKDGTLAADPNAAARAERLMLSQNVSIQ